MMKNFTFKLKKTLLMLMALGVFVPLVSAQENNGNPGKATNYYAKVSITRVNGTGAWAYASYYKGHFSGDTFWPGDKTTDIEITYSDVLNNSGCHGSCSGTPPKFTSKEMSHESNTFRFRFFAADSPTSQSFKGWSETEDGPIISTEQGYEVTVTSTNTSSGGTVKNLYAIYGPSGTPGGQESITPTPTSLSWNNGTSSYSQFSFTVQNLSKTITVTAPANFQVSTNSTSWSNSLTLSSASTVYVKCTATNPNTYTGDVSLESQYCVTKKVSLSCTIPQPASLELGAMYPTSLSNDGVGTVSVKGSGLGDKVNVTVSGSDFQISADQTSWSNNVNFTTSSSSINETLYVHINPSVVGLQNDLQATLTAQSNYVSDVTRSIAGSVTPTLSVSPASITDMVDLEERTFTVSGTRLSGNNVTITPPAGFQVKQGSGEWSSAAITVSGTNVNSSVTFSVRMNVIGSHNKNITVATTATADGSLSKTINVSGTVSDNWWNAVPSVPAGYYADKIDSAEDLAWFAKQGGNGTLTADINLAGHPWVPIANYTGTFNGNGQPQLNWSKSMNFN